MVVRAMHQAAVRARSTEIIVAHKETATECANDCATIGFEKIAAISA